MDAILQFWMWSCHRPGTLSSSCDAEIFNWLRRGRGECRSYWDNKNDRASLYFACLLVFSTAIRDRIDRTCSLNARAPYPISISWYSNRVLIWYADKYFDGEFLNMPIMAWSISSKVTSRDTFTVPSTQYFRHSRLIRIFEKWIMKSTFLRFIYK